jgi:Tol biopolymer transport system component
MALGLPIALASCRSEGDGTAVAQVRGESALAAATVDAASTEPRPDVTLRRLWAGDYTDFYASSISPDSRYMSMIDWATSNLAVRDLSTGEVHRLTDVQNEEGKPYEGAGVSVFSPDGRRILYSWEYGEGIQLRVIDFEPDAAGVPHAAEPAVIFHNPELTPYVLFDWSPDGSRVLAKVYTAGNSNQLALISTDDGSYRALKSFDWREPDRAAISPDGRYVAYDFQPELDSPNSDVFVVSVDGTYEATMVDDPASDGLLGWHPDGAILFYSRRGGSLGVWRLPMADGRPAGPAELVRADMLGVEPLGFAGGRFYYGVNVNPPRLYTASVDFETGRMVGAPITVEDPARIRVNGWDWSPDGNFLAYSGSVPGAGGSLVVIRSDRGEEVRALRLELGATRRIRWTPDGGSLIVFARDDKGRRGFHRIDLETGSYTTIVRDDQLDHPTPRGDFDVSADGRTIFFATHPPDTDRWTLVAYDIESGTARSITPAEWRMRGEAMSWIYAAVSASPDGSRLAIVAPDTASNDRLIGTIPTDGGPFTPLARVDDGDLIQGPEWSADGRFVVFSTGRLGTRGWEAWKTWIVPADGAEARPLELVEDHDDGRVRLHPDGRRITFRAGDSRGEVWVMDGLGQSAMASREERSSR